VLGFNFLSQNDIYANEPPSINLIEHKDGDVTGDNYQFIVDNDQDFTIEDVASTNKWQSPELGVTNRGFSVVTTWMRFSLNNPTDTHKDIILEYVDPAAANVDVYHRPSNTNDSFKLKEFTYNEPVKNRPVSFYRPAFLFHIEPNSSRDIYVRTFAGDHFPMHNFTAMRVWNEKTFDREKHKELSLLIILICTEILMGIATLVLFYLTRDTVFLYYSIFVFSAASLFASFSGLWGYFISPDGYELWRVVLQITSMG